MFNRSLSKTLYLRLIVFVSLLLLFMVGILCVNKQRAKYKETYAAYESKTLIVRNEDLPKIDISKARKTETVGNITLLEYSSSKKTCESYQQTVKEPDAYSFLNKSDAVVDFPVYVAGETTEGLDSNADVTDLNKMVENADTVAKPTKTVAVIDTGWIDGPVTKSDKILDEVVLTKDGTKSTNPHGTYIASLIAAWSDPGTRIIPICVATSDEKTYLSDVAKAIVYAVDSGVDYINISMTGVSKNSSEYADAILGYATAKGIPVITAAGNDAVSTTLAFPACAEDAVVVSSVTKDKEVALYSNFGPSVDCASYGSVAVGDTEVSGTSYSAALVTAAYTNGLTYENAVDICSEGKDLKTGYGLLVPNGYEPIDDAEDSYYKYATILGMDWRSMTDAEITSAVNNSSTYLVKLFIESLSDSDYDDLLARRTSLSAPYSYMVNDVPVEYDSYVEYINNTNDSCLVPSGTNEVGGTGDYVCAALGKDKKGNVIAKCIKGVTTKELLKVDKPYKTTEHGVKFELIESNKWDDNGTVKVRVYRNPSDDLGVETHACLQYNESDQKSHKCYVNKQSTPTLLYKEDPTAKGESNEFRYAITLNHRICDNKDPKSPNSVDKESVVIYYGFNDDLSKYTSDHVENIEGNSYELKSLALDFCDDNEQYPDEPKVSFYKDNAVDDHGTKLNSYGEGNSQVKDMDNNVLQLHTSITWESNIAKHSWAKFTKTDSNDGTLMDFHDGGSITYTFGDIYKKGKDTEVCYDSGNPTTWYLRCTSDASKVKDGLDDNDPERKNADGDKIANIGISFPTDGNWQSGVLAAEPHHYKGYTAAGKSLATNEQTLYTGPNPAAVCSHACVVEVTKTECEKCGVTTPINPNDFSRGHKSGGTVCNNKYSKNERAYAFSDTKYPRYGYVEKDGTSDLALKKDKEDTHPHNEVGEYARTSDGKGFYYPYMYLLCGRKAAHIDKNNNKEYYCTAAVKAWAKLGVKFKLQKVDGTYYKDNQPRYFKYFKLYDSTSDKAVKTSKVKASVNIKFTGASTIQGNTKPFKSTEAKPRNVVYNVKRPAHTVNIQVKPIDDRTVNTAIPMKGYKFKVTCNGGAYDSQGGLALDANNSIKVSNVYASGNMTASVVCKDVPGGRSDDGEIEKEAPVKLKSNLTSSSSNWKDGDACTNIVEIHAPDLPTGLQYESWEVSAAYKNMQSVPTVKTSDWKNLTFAMPNKDVTVTLYVKPTDYNVYFHIVDPSKTYNGISTINNAVAPNATFTAPKPGSSVPSPSEQTVIAPESDSVAFTANDKATFVMRTWLYRYDYIPKPDELWANKPTGWHFIPNANGFSSDYFRNDSDVLSQLDAVKTADSNLFTKQTGKDLNTYQQWNLSTNGADVHLYCYLEPDRYRIALHESESNAGKSPITNVPACERSTTLAETVVTIPTDLADKGWSLVSNRDPLWDIDVPETNTWYQKHRGYLLQDVSEYKLHSNTWEHYNIKRAVDKNGGVTRAWAVPAVSTRPSSVVTYDNVTQTFGRSKFVGWICNIGTKRANDSSDYVVDGTGISWGTYTNPDNITCADKAIICSVGDSKFLKTLRDYDSNDLRKPSIGDLQTYNLYPVYDAVPEIYPQVMYKTVDNMSCMFKSPDANGKRSLLNVNDAWGDTSPNFNWKGVFGYWNIDLNDNTIQPVAINNPTSKPTTKLEYALLYEQANGYSPMIVDRETTNYHYNSGKVGGLKSRDFEAANNSVHNIQDLSDDVTISTGQLKQKFYIDKFAEIPWTASPITTQYMVPWTVVDDIGQSYTFKQYVYVSTKNNLTLQRDNEGFVDITVQ